MMNRDQMREAAFEYIEVDYNRTRRHSGTVLWDMRVLKDVSWQKQLNPVSIFTASDQLRVGIQCGYAFAENEL